MPYPADKTVPAFLELAWLVQLTEWPGKEGQPWKAPDSHCVLDEVSSRVLQRSARTRAAGRHTKAPSRRKQHKGRIKGLLICFYLLAVEETVTHSARKTWSLARADGCVCQFGGIT